jgi:chemotaxis regulatin CheY-phosphate phosphatase CheZ
MHHPSAHDDVGRQILGIFIRHGVAVGGTLTRNYFIDVRDGDFQRGIDAAVAQNWIAVDTRNRYRYVLTATGFSAGRMMEAPAQVPAQAQAQAPTPAATVEA